MILIEMIPTVDLRAQYGAIKREIDEAIQRVLDRGQFILGPEGEALEREVAVFCGIPHAVAVASGTDALELALRACGVGPGDEVITTAFSFFATAGAIASLGARPVFVDIDPATYTLDPSQLERAVSPRAKAIIPVHLYGHPCDMEPLLALASARRLRIIEDCAQAFGAAHRGRRVGGFGDAAAFSFYPTKNLGAYGDGGMVLTRDAALADTVRLLRMHGSRDRVHHEVVSRNSRLDEIQAAILRVKLRYVDQWNDRRRSLARAYDQAFAQRRLTEFVLPQERAGNSHVYHLYVVRTRQRSAIRQALAQRGIATQVHYELPLPREPALADLGYRAGAFPNAEAAAAEVLSLPMYPELTPVLIDEVVGALASARNLPTFVSGKTA